MHEALACYTQELISRHLSWKDVTDEERRRMIAAAVHSSISRYGPALFSDTARSAYTLERVTRILTRSVWGLTLQLGAGDFVPAGFETPLIRHPARKRPESGQERRALLHCADGLTGRTFASMKAVFM